MHLSGTYPSRLVNIASFLSAARSLFVFLGLILPNTAAFADVELASHRLRPPDTSSPQATLRSFLTDLEEAYRIAQGPEAEDSQFFLSRAVRCLDLSRVPAEFKSSTGLESALMLKEVFDRIEMPSMSDVPAEQGEGLQRWVVPDTPIAIIRKLDGPRKGEYLFSSETVERAREFYAQVQDLPYRPGATEGLYTAYLTSPGQGLTSGWSFFLPDWSKGVFAEQTYWQWIALGATLLAVLAATTPALLVARFHRARPADEAAQHPWRVGLIALILLAIAAYFAADWFIDEVVNLTGPPLVVVTYVLAVLNYAALAWLATVLTTQAGELVIRLQGREHGSAGARLIRLASWVLAGFAIVSVMVVAGQNFGFPLYSMLTGLGIGGIAIGFGAQTLIRDIISGVFFLVDDAFHEGEYIEAGRAKGVVERISVRSIQLRHHNGPLNTIPFGEIKQVTNFSRDWVVMKLPIRVPFGTDPDRVRKIIKKLGHELLDDPEIGPKFLEPLKSSGVLEIDDFGIVIRVKFMTTPGEQFTLRSIAYTKIQEAFEKAGIPFAGREVRLRTEEDDSAESRSPSAQDKIAKAVDLADEDATAAE